MERQIAVPRRSRAEVQDRVEVGDRQEFFLRQQLKAINGLGGGDDDSGLGELKEKLAA
jgi:hypothetical protein